MARFGSCCHPLRHNSAWGAVKRTFIVKLSHNGCLRTHPATFVIEKNLKKVCRSGENSYNFANFGGGCVPETLAPARYSPAVFRGGSATQAEPSGARAAVQSTRGGEAEASPQLRNGPRLPSILSRLLRGTTSLKLPHGSCSWKLPQLKLRSAASGELTPLLAAKLKQPSWPRMLKLSKAS